MSCTCSTRNGRLHCRMEAWQRDLDFAIERGDEKLAGLARGALTALDDAGCRK